MREATAKPQDDKKRATTSTRTVVSAKAGDGASSPWMNGADLIDTLLDPGSHVAQVLRPEQVQGLEGIRRLLVTAHIQHDAIPADLTACKDPMMYRSLAEEFGGVRRRMDLKTAAKSVLNGLKFIRVAQLQMTAKAESSRRVTKSHKAYLPPEFQRLSTSRQNYLYGLLRYDALSLWGYDAAELSTSCGEAPLLFVGWAILCAPYAQIAMAEYLGLDPPGEADEAGAPYEFVDEFGLRPEVLCNFLRLVEADYPDNPYHNSIHAADVTQTTFALLRMGGDKYSSSPVDLYSIIVAAACHDMGHPGRNNSYQIHAKSDLAVIYNDASVLENMSAARAYRLLNAPPEDELQCDILSAMPTRQQEAFRATFIRGILATDMSQHFAKVAQLKSRISSHGVENPEKFYIPFEGRSLPLVLMAILHAADISNPAKPAPIFVEWCDRCLAEFFAQGDAEKRKGLPVSPMCDQNLTVRSDSQLGFGKFIVRPTFVLLSDLVPRIVDEVLPVLESNLRYWEHEKLREEEEHTTEEEGDTEP